MSSTKKSDKKAETETICFKFRLDPTPEQIEQFELAAKASRWGFNSYLAHWSAADRAWRNRRDEHVNAGMTVEQANAETKQEAKEDGSLRALPPNDFAKKVLTPHVKRHRQAAVLIEELSRGDLTAAERKKKSSELKERWDYDDGRLPFLHQVTRRAPVGGIRNANAAVQRFITARSQKTNDSGRPRFKKRGWKKTIYVPAENTGAHGCKYKTGNRKIDSYHRLRLGPFDVVRTFDSTKKISKAIAQGAEPTSFTITERAGYWYVSINLARVKQAPSLPTRRQKANGSIGGDFGVTTWLMLSDGRSIELPSELKEIDQKVRNLQRKRARSEEGSNRRKRLDQRIARLHHKAALQCESFIHQVTKELVSTYQLVGLENLNVKGMTRSAKGTVEQPGKNVRAKSGLNRAILAGRPYELRRQVVYKAPRYGSTAGIIDRFYASSKNCSACGYYHKGLTREDRVYECPNCGLAMDRDLNAALNIRAEAEQGVEG